MPRRRSRPLPTNADHPTRDDALHRLLRLWSLRILVPLGGHRELIATHGFMSDSISRLIDLGDDLTDPDTLGVDTHAVMKRLKQQHTEAEQAAASTPLPDRLQQNLQRLGSTLSLSAIECQLLAFTALLHSENTLEEVCELRGSLSSNEVIRTLSVILDLPVKEVREALGANSALTRSGLLRLDRTSDGRLSHKLDMLSPQFADSLCSTDAEALHLLREIIHRTSDGTLTQDDYPHLCQELSLLLPYMKEMLESGFAGVNILLYGEPGTGKTELARMLARQIGTPLYEIANADEEGDPVRGDRRLRALRTGQQVLAQQSALLLFDEIEDVFGGNAPLFGQLALGQQLKGWINRTLEENPVPTLWVSNEIRDMDPAFLRRFCMVIEVPVPPRSQRQHMIGYYAPSTLSPETIARLADHDSLSPAVVAQACQVAFFLPQAEQTEETVEQLINNALRAQGHRPIPTTTRTGLPKLYDLAHLNVDADLPRLTSGLARTGQGRLCLYGPPGTGKTAFAYWLAEELDLPLIARSASDLLSPWLGETEQQIARLLAEAEREQAVLLLDEVDSFLHQRQQTSRSWEVTQVNELLVRIEQHRGIIVACTNRLEGMDRASLRRFDRKIHFAVLRPERAWELLHRYCDALQLEPPRENDWMDMAALQELTPGDFHAVARRHELEPLASTEAFIQALRTEHGLKS